MHMMSACKCLTNVHLYLLLPLTPFPHIFPLHNEEHSIILCCLLVVFNWKHIQLLMTDVWWSSFDMIQSHTHLTENAGQRLTITESLLLYICNIVLKGNFTSVYHKALGISCYILYVYLKKNCQCSVKTVYE